MAGLLDLLSPYPVLESLVSVLPLGDLFNLSKTNSKFRAALHGFEPPRPNGQWPSNAPLRASLYIGEHDTPFWKNLKARSPSLCSESTHTRGDNVQGCLMCSMPVCEACIIKESFGKRDEKTFQHRTRSLCPGCFDSETSHIEQTLKPGMKGKNAIHSLVDSEPTCICTAKNGYLCLRCKNKQKSDLETKLARCYGEGCSETQLGGFPGRICLWCDLRLPNKRSRAEARREYDARHLSARSHASFEHPEEEELIYPVDQDHIWRMEEERIWELKNLADQRERTAAAAEDERWRRAEALRRSNSMYYPPPPIVRQRTDDVAESSGRQRSDSTSSTLVERDQSPLPSYESSILSTNTTTKGSQQYSDAKT